MCKNPMPIHKKFFCSDKCQRRIISLTDRECLHCEEKLNRQQEKFCSTNYRNGYENNINKLLKLKTDDENIIQVKNKCKICSIQCKVTYCKEHNKRNTGKVIFYPNGKNIQRKNNKI